MTDNTEISYWKRIWIQFKKHPLGLSALYILCLFFLVAIYAPFLASSKPIFVQFNGENYFPLFRYLLYPGFYTKAIDIFFNLMIYTFPIFLLALLLWKKNHAWGRIAMIATIVAHFAIFAYIELALPNDPATDVQLISERQATLKADPNKLPNWNFDLKFMTSYAKLDMVLKYRLRKMQDQKLQKYAEKYVQTAPGNNKQLPTLWQINKDNESSEMTRLQELIDEQNKSGKTDSEAYITTKAKLQYIQDRANWLEDQNSHLNWMIMPLLSHFHWQDDAGGQQALNRYLQLNELTRINRKDLLSALIFGVRISIVVGIASVALALLIGIPIGAFAGYYGGRTDIVVSRLLEIWESMPTFFMLLMVVAILQNKSIFFVIGAIGLFGWTGFSRYIRGEFFKQRSLPYVEACKALGFRDGYIMFKHILPNAIPPILALLPFAIMGAVTSEAGLSFLGLGEEGSSSWGVLMDEGRSAFPEESYLLWPPAILLTIFLVAIALVGDSLRDALDPKMHQ